ncbi:NACHT, LRR and PYD domains-containing protein 3-like isoform X2 [Montipora foliosa]|uniref:NACHT, LRR and PYD domains-containing protein 3-like isoform X2 n=1 Tax=Montipora foliosa TaxID=591990 RepID=UPI0035F12529
MASGLWQQSQEHGPNKVQVTILASEWGSSRGGLSTINRELAIQLAKFSEVEITYFLPKCSEEDRKVALSRGIKILEATPRPGFEEMDWLSFPPTHLEIDVIVGHGVKLGRQAQVIRDHHKCVWFQVVHTDPEELGMFKCYENPISRGEEKHNVEVELCKMANFVIGVGPKLAEAFRKYLRCCKRDQDVFEFTPGIFDDFVNVQQVPEERKQLSVLVFGRGDAEDFELKGFDIAATSVAALPDTHLVFVGAADGKYEEIANRLLKCGIPKNRLRVRSYMKSRESLKELFCEVDLVLMPSRTEGFGLAGLEALSAGLPVIVSKNSGFGEALGNVPFGSSFVIDSEDPNAWTAAIKDIWNKNRRTRLGEAKVLRDSYGMIYSWSEQCKDLKKMINSLNEQVGHLTKSNETALCQDNPMPTACPEKLVELIKRDYKGAVLCPFPWCEDELQFELSNIFTRLQIISKKKERARLTGNIVNMTDVFAPHKECDRPRVVLIEGQPGMGKTTYCQKLAYDWSMAGIPPEASFPIVEILLLLKCRNMKTADIEEDINDQLLPLDAEKKEKENFFEFIRRNQSKILLVLDGLDELRHDLLQGFLPLIKGKVFSNVYLMLTARHEAGTEVRRYCDTLLEIVGFTNEDAESYIKNYFTNHENPSLAKKMIKKLKRSPQLWELTHNPLNTALLCLVFEDSEGKFPSNRTKLYDELVSCALRRYCAKKEVSLCNNDYIEAFAEQLSLLGKMAFEALLNNQGYFTGDELKCQSTEFLEFGFLSREASMSKIRPNPSYSFTHKTFQEYFAAFHLAHQLLKEDVEKVTLLAQLSPVDKYWQVWGFLITLVASKGDDVADFVVSRLCNSFFRNTQINILPKWSWAEEEESEEEEEDVSNSSDDFFFYDMSYDEDSEDFDDNEDGVVADINEDSGGGNDSFEVAVCKDDSFSWSLPLERSALEDIRVESFLTETCNLIADCEGGRNELKDYQKKMIHTLASCFPLFTVRVPSRGVHNIRVLCEYLKENSALTELLWYASLDELALGTINHILQTSQRLVGLHLRTDLNSTSLTPALQSNSTLTRLNLRYARIRISGAKALGEVLQSNRTLTHLNLHANMLPCKQSLFDLISSLS